ncbi:hypothetical protein EZV73_10185 [Acidaminobacter sp. JC074]|uniref:Na+/H+ antiporter NhaC family protein n=1 Tax=Acidaminobacter sp. JC074 TaxID=2530199 RepID=UPI001F0FF1E8|nr:Na+/H+ antiporter NhaC family protein [Acidaminobacter sp. JC074]MCH4887943.1 hypothetical protein [Acidaminobacter sp. JC074]
MDKNLKEKKKRLPSKIEAFSVLIFVILGVSLGSQFGVSIGSVLILSAVYSIIVGIRCGYTYKELEGAIIEKINDIMSVFFILLAIGMLIGTWMFSGTIPTAIYYLVSIVDPRMVIVLGFLVCAIVATIIGTSWGTAGTIGVVMIGLAQVLDVPMPVMAGAVIAGSHYGQLISPMSDMVAISSSMAKVDPMEMIKRTLIVVVPSTIISIALYAFIGFTNAGVAGSSAMVDELLTTIKTLFNVNPIVLLPLVFIIFTSVKKYPSAPSMILSGFLAIIIGVVFNGFSLGDGLTAAFDGFNVSMTGVDPETVMTQVTSLINRGGMLTMSYVIILLFCAMIFAGVVSKIKCLDVIVSTLAKNVKSIGGLTVAVIIASIVTAITTLQAYLTIIVPSELFEKKYIENGYHPVNMVVAAQTIGAIIMVMFPWGDTGLYMAGVTGVPTLSYAPYAFFCWGTAIIAIVFAFLKIGVKKLDIKEVKEQKAV